MTLQDILVILQNRILVLNEARKSAVNSGDLLQISAIDEDLLSTRNSIQQLQTSTS